MAELDKQDVRSNQVPNRVHAQHILLLTVGKPDAEVQEIKKKAEDVLKQAKKGAKFDECQEYSEDPGSKDKGGDLGWIIRETNRSRVREGGVLATRRHRLGSGEDSVRLPHHQGP